MTDQAKGAFDGEQLLSRVENDWELLDELFEDFVEDTAERMEGAASAAESGDFENLKERAHALKGCIANFCADGVRGLAAELERAAADRDASACTRLVGALGPELEGLTEGLRSFLEKRGA